MEIGSLIDQFISMVTEYLFPYMMAIKGYCGKSCDECNGCPLDEQIPCSPNCENLTRDGMIKIAECLKAECEEIKYIFDMVNCSDNEIIKRYGTIAPYPYTTSCK